ncbi:MAG: dethiobiotin synthase [Rikenellaceae bacterium]
MDKGVYFITGIDTNIGKSIATGWLANELRRMGVNLTTQKMIQTGNETISEDIELHRQIMGEPLSDLDLDGTTCPIIFTYPASPHLAARIDGREADLSLIERSSKRLAELYDVVLLEGAGGLMVPLTEDILTIDYVAQRGYPVILVTSGRLGSINHTILSIEAIKSRGLRLETIIYNRFLKCDELIESDTREYLASYIKKFSPETTLLVMDEVNLSKQ